jgi:hypothetical protein
MLALETVHKRFANSRLLPAYQLEKMSPHLKSSPRGYNIVDPSKSYCETRLKSKSIEFTFDNMLKACCKRIVGGSPTIDRTVRHLMAMSCRVSYSRQEEWMRHYYDIIII